MLFRDLTDTQKTELWACLALLHIPRIGSVRRKKLIERFGSAYAALQASSHWNEAAIGLQREQSDFATRGLWRAEAWKIWQNLRQLDASLLLWTDSNYPDALKLLPDAPILLFCRGDLSLLNNPALGVVGARKCTQEGITVTANIVRRLSRAGMTTVSGLARGIDRVAHLAALDGVGSTIAVLGCGIDVCYPHENEELFHLLARKGLILTEFMPGVHPLPHHFPVRNRIISGLSQGVLVVEAAMKSGSLVTAQHALEQNRTVFAVPGGTLAETSEGCRYLIRHGVKPVFSGEDILLELAPSLGAALEKMAHQQHQDASSDLLPAQLPWEAGGTQRAATVDNTSAPANDNSTQTGLTNNAAGNKKNPSAPAGYGKQTDHVRNTLSTLSEPLKTVFHTLVERGEPTHVDDLCRASAVPIAALHGALIMLEVKGLVTRMPGMFYTVTP